MPMKHTKSSERSAFDRSRGVGKCIHLLSNTILRSARRAYAQQAGVFTVESWILRQMEHGEPVSVRELAHELSLDEAQVSKAVTNLKNQNRLTMVRDKQDKRRKLLRLTKLGKTTLETVLEIHSSRQASLLRGISKADQSRFFAITEQMYANALGLLDDELATSVGHTVERRAQHGRPTPR